MKIHMDKYGPFLFIGGVILLFIILKLLGFPEFLYE